MQVVMELQESTRRLKGTVDALSRQVAERQRAMRRTVHALWTAGGAPLALGLVVVGWLDHRIDEIANALAMDGG